jgi:hypothetical protein
MRASDDAVWASIEATIRDVLLPALDDAHARLTAIQLAGLAGYARTRRPDPTAARDRELAVLLDGLELAPAHGTVAERCAAALVAAVGRDDDAAREVRRVLRSALVRHLDEDLADGAVIGEAFRGRLAGA